MTIFIDSASNPIVCTAKGPEPGSFDWFYSNGEKVGVVGSTNTNSESVVKGSFSTSSYSQTLTLTLGASKEDRSYTCKAVWGDEELTGITTVTVLGKIGQNISQVTSFTRHNSR